MIKLWYFSKAIFIFRLTLLFLQLKPYLCLSENHFGDCVPKKCGNLSISYPFYMLGQQKIYCGYPGFEISCRDDKFASINISGSSYVIKNVSYGEQTVQVVNSLLLDSFGGEIACSGVLNHLNLTMNNDVFKYSVKDNHVFLVLNCPEKVLHENSPSWVYCGGVGVYGNETRLNDLKGKCGNGVVVSVPYEGERKNDGNLKAMLEEGFALKWSANNCSACKASKGQCGYDQEISEFSCFCPDKTHARQCPPPVLMKKKNLNSRLLLALGGEKIVYSSSPYRGVGGGGSGGGIHGGGGTMVFLEGVRRFELEDLLRASAEMLGKGVFGTAYKAVLDDGTVVAVKRLKEANVGGGKKEFEQLMEVLGRLKHPNLVSLKAYYFARAEKLLVFDYLPNGSLFWLLHGNRGPGRTPLDWTTRLKIAGGAARGVAFIHNSCRELRLIHGNIKSTNILIDKSGDACVSDFGISSFSPTLSNNSKSNGYRAPETLDGRKLTQKADVYSFGVLLLELLTGKYPSVMEGSGPYGTVGVGGMVDLPRWVQSVVREEWTAEVFDLELMRYKDIEEEMVGLLQVAMACTSLSPDQRPKMGQVVKMIDEIRGVEASPAHDNFDSDSPCVSEDTGGVSQ